LFLYCNGSLHVVCVAITSEESAFSAVAITNESICIYECPASLSICKYVKVYKCWFFSTDAKCTYSIF